MLKLQQNSDIWQIYCIRQPKTTASMLAETCFSQKKPVSFKKNSPVMCNQFIVNPQLKSHLFKTHVIQIMYCAQLSKSANDVKNL
ncbi:hypothetical protein BpHYR1_016549 [Brachionus plicatilis]|uniref:Uncharacterized protein n=1 Tax=Brachionus plicatilis TaxID=10195 RepID=A0A3M7T3B0_BRAPC|nr:hypothetical protein BpHYR1_016549 [Brachionus plicatilis]